MFALEMTGCAYYHGSMQKRTRRPHGIASRKISISVSEQDLEILTLRAARMHGGNISAVIHEMVASLKRQEAAEELLTVLGGERVTEEALQSLRDEVAAAPKRRRK